jgi:hypothetical protein
MLTPHIRKMAQRIAVLDREGLIDLLRSLPEYNPIDDEDLVGLTLVQLREAVLKAVLDHYHRLWA